MNDQRPPVTSYNVYHNVTPDGYIEIIGDTRYTINIDVGFNYYFIVSANNMIGQGLNATVHGIY